MNEGPGIMILKQYYLDCLSHASYLVADEGTRRAVVVDPQPTRGGRARGPVFAEP